MLLMCVCVCVCGFADRLAEMRTQLQQYQGKVTDMYKTWLMFVGHLSYESKSNEISVSVT